jgi:hypothetical protein
LVAHRQRQQIGVGDLAVAVQAREVDGGLVQHRHVVGREGVIDPFGQRAQALGHLARCCAVRGRVGRCTEDAHGAAFDDGAGGDAARRGIEPLVGAAREHVCVVEQRDQHVHVEQRARLRHGLSHPAAATPPP